MFGPKYTIRSKDGRTEMKFWFRSSYEKELARIKMDEEIETAKKNGNYHRIAADSCDELEIIKDRLFEIGAKIVGDDGYRLEYICPAFVKVDRDYSGGNDHYSVGVAVLGRKDDLDRIGRGQPLC